MGRNKKDDENKKKPAVHKDLDGFEIKVNSFGEVVSNIEIDKINKFLDDNVEDKKLKGDVNRKKKD